MSSIRKREWRTPAGRKKVAWQVSWVDSFGRRKAKQFATRAEAQEWLATTDLHDLQDERSETVADATKSWLTRAEAQGLERSTVRAYRFIADRYIVPMLGAIRLDDLKQQQVVESWKLINQTKSAYMGSRMVKHLKMIMNHADGAGILKKNVVAGLRVGRSNRHQTRPSIPTRQEISAIQRVLNADWENSGPTELNRLRRKPFHDTHHETGCRPSELRGLAWKDVHLDKGYIEITQRADAWNTIGACKTRAAYRRIPISEDLVTCLTAWKGLCPASPYNLVFPTRSGGVIHARDIVREFRSIQVRAGVTKPMLDAQGKQRLTPRGKPRVTGKYRLYDQRHVRASIWIAERLNLKALATRMGHSSIQVTFDVYGHLIEDEGDTVP